MHEWRARHFRRNRTFLVETVPLHFGVLHFLTVWPQPAHLDFGIPKMSAKERVKGSGICARLPALFLSELFQQIRPVERLRHR